MISENVCSETTEPSSSEVVQMIQSETHQGGPQHFDFSGWSPEPPAGLHFLGLTSFGSGYRVNQYGQYPQETHKGKVKVSTQHRKSRQKRFTNDLISSSHDERRLLHATETNNQELMQELLESGLDPSSCDDKKRTPLHIAAAKGHEDAVSLLLDNGANPNRQDVIGNTPLHLAACTKNIGVVTLLLQSGTDVHSMDKTGKTPLHLAMSKLSLITKNQNYTSEETKSEIIKIITMMKAYLTLLPGEESHISELDTLCTRLQNVRTDEQVSTVNTLLENFTELSLQRNERANI